MFRIIKLNKITGDKERKMNLLASYYDGTGVGISTGLLVFIIILSLGIDIAIIVGCAKVAARKGHSASLWGVLGFFFGLIALLILACLPDVSGGYQPRTHYNGGTQYASRQYGAWECPRCKTVNSGGANFCRTCGAAAPVARNNAYGQQSNTAYNQAKGKTTYQAATTTYYPQEKWTCPNCGEKNVMEVRACINCGKPRE